MADRVKIRKIYSSILARKNDATEYSDGDSLVFSGRLDSVNVLEIMGRLDAELGFSVPEELFDLKHFDSVDALAALIDSQSGKPA